MICVPIFTEIRSICQKETMIYDFFEKQGNNRQLFKVGFILFYFPIELINLHSHVT